MKRIRFVKTENADGGVRYQLERTDRNIIVSIELQVSQFDMSRNGGQRGSVARALRARRSLLLERVVEQTGGR